MLSQQEQASYQQYLRDEQEAFSKLNLAYGVFSTAAYAALVGVYAESTGQTTRAMLAGVTRYYEAALQELTDAVKDIIELWLLEARRRGWEMSGGTGDAPRDIVDVSAAVDYWMDRLKRDLENETLRGLMRGWPIEKTNHLLSGRISTSKSHIEFLLRAEGHKAHQKGAFDGASSQVGTVRKMWVGILDDKIRHDHREATGQERELNEPFLVGGHLAMYPGAPGLPIEQTANCRCICSYLIR